MNYHPHLEISPMHSQYSRGCYESPGFSQIRWISQKSARFLEVLIDWRIEPLLPYGLAKSFRAAKKEIWPKVQITQINRVEITIYVSYQISQQNPKYGSSRAHEGCPASSMRWKRMRACPSAFFWNADGHDPSWRSRVFDMNPRNSIGTADSERVSRLAHYKISNPRSCLRFFERIPSDLWWGSPDYWDGW
jgi:hypothetical protein